MGSGWISSRLRLKRVLKLRLRLTLTRRFGLEGGGLGLGWEVEVACALGRHVLWGGGEALEDNEGQRPRQSLEYSSPPLTCFTSFPSPTPSAHLHIVNHYLSGRLVL